MRLSRLQLVAGVAGLVLGTAASAYYVSEDADASPTNEVAFVDAGIEQDEAPAGPEVLVVGEREAGEPAHGAEVLPPPKVDTNDAPDPAGMPPSEGGALSDPPAQERDVGAARVPVNGIVTISLSGTCLLGEYSIQIGENKLSRKRATMKLPVGSHDAVVSAKVNLSSTSFHPTKRSRTVSFMVEPESESKLTVNLCKG